MTDKVAPTLKTDLGNSQDAIQIDYDPFADASQLQRVISSTEAQQEIWSSIQMADEASCSFNESVSLRLSGTLNSAALVRALEYVVQRHEALRTTFTSDGSQLCILESIDFEVETIDGKSTPYEVIKKREVNLSFDLEKGPLFRACIVKESQDNVYLLLTAHHIVCDGWSLAIIINDIASSYSAYVSGLTPEQDTAFAFSQFVEQNQRELIDSNDEKYWLDLFAGFVPEFELPNDKSRPAFRTFNSTRIDFPVDVELMSKVKKVSASKGCSLTATMLAAYYVCLHRWSGENELVVGIPAASQPSYAPESLVGHCVNMLPILASVDPSSTISNLMVFVRDRILDSYEHQNYTYGTLLKKLPINRDPSRIPLVPTLFNVDQGIQGGDLRFTDLDVEFYSNPRDFENFEIFINASDYGDRFIIECQYNTDLFSSDSINRRLQEYVNVLKAIAEDVDSVVERISLLDSDTRQKQLAQLDVIRDWNELKGEEKSLVHILVDGQLSRTPDAVALTCGSEEITCLTLTQKSNQFAHHLKKIGVGADDFVGVCLDRSVNMMVALLGILKAGAAYVPLDPDFPVDRLTYMAEDAELQYLVTQDDYDGMFSQVKNKIMIESIESTLAGLSVLLPSCDCSKNSTAYVIYTSGSTGKPKGVMVQHSAVTNFLKAMAERPGLDQSNNLLAITTLSFDIAVLELYLPLVVGAHLVIAKKDECVDGNKLIELIATKNIDVMQATPATWRMLISAGWKGDNEFKVLCGGEALPKDLAAELLSRSGELWNMYGPTETTVWSTCDHVTSVDKPLGIGLPIANTEIYILDNQLEPVPEGVAGELYIGGEGVTKGYLKREELTQERFVANPFTQVGKIYGTGDKVRRCLDGTLEYMGRLDNQVKLRGYRIELGEIETLLRQHDNVDDCALAIKEFSSGDARLIAYIVWQGSTIELAALREFLLQWLPNYMLPQHCVTLKQLPKTPNGKLDRKSLPKPKIEKESSRIYSEPKTKTESVLVSIWKSVLGMASVSTADNFFDLGGHSLLIAQVIQKLEVEQQIKIQYRDIFQYPTIIELAIKVDNMSNADSVLQNPISIREEKELNILSLAQKRLWYLEKMNPGTTGFNLPSAFRLFGKLNVDALNNAFSEMISRHDTLRSELREQGEEPFQFIHKEISFTLGRIDFSGSEAGERENLLQEQLDKLQQHVLDVAQAPLFLATVIKLTDVEHVLFFMPHHLVFDGWSFDIFIHEMTTLYQKHTNNEFEALAELPIQYADYTLWLRDLLAGGELDKQLQFWAELLDGELPVLDMPLDHPRPEILQGQGDELHFELNEDLVGSLVSLANKHEASLFMVLMTAYLSLVYRYTGQTDQIVGVPMADRARPGTENLIGFFVNALVLRFKFNAKDSFVELLERVKDNCLSGFSNQDVPFERIVELLNPNRDLSRAPLFQTSMTYQDVSAREIKMADIDIQQVEIPTRESPLDMNIWFKRRGDKVSGAVVYNLNLFERESIGQFCNDFVGLLGKVVQNKHQPIRQLFELSKEESARIAHFSCLEKTVWNEPLLLTKLISSHAVTSPEKICARCGSDEINYQDLDEKSNQLAGFLLAKGVSGNVLIGLCVDRSINMLISLLGILKSGGAYVPLDPEYPEDRLSYMVEDAKLEFLITQDKYIDQLPTVKNSFLVGELFGESGSALGKFGSNELDVKIDENDAAYVIYTSGSTGKPKGVVVPHKGLSNFVKAMAVEPGLSVSDELLAVTTLSFDIAVLELYLPLSVGASVSIATRDEAIDGRKLLKLIKGNNITCMQATPATWRMLLGAGWTSDNSIKVLCGGEALPKDLAGELFTRSSELWNMYGPTETTVWSTCTRITDPSLAITLGRAIANTTLFVLDERCQLVPQGVAGELYIGGDGVTKGYLHREELTAERFVENPFSGEGKVYRTGDKVRFRRDGELEYLGRLDSQVKLRGFRIELGEIETTMRKHENIEDCALAIKEPVPGDVRLVAYVVWAGSPVTLTELRKFLKQWMPAHMIPQTLVDIDVLPRTPNGKLDRKSLPDVFTSVTESISFVEPNTDVSRWLAKTWQEVIGVNKVGLNDNFFDVGGHSLLSMQVIYKVKSQYDVSLSPRDLLLETLEQQASKIQNVVVDTSTKDDSEIASVSNKGAQGESAEQKTDEQAGKKKKGLMARLFR